jgi:putative Holliday junction resolvase
MQHYGILGIDWGSSKVGVAVADTETGLALGITTLRNDDQLLEHLQNFAAEYNVRLAVVGIPSRVNREEVVYGGEQLGATLEKQLHLKVVYHNEMYTTKMARANLVEQGVRNLDRHDDREAARLILQSWLDSHTEYDIL